MEQFSLIIFYYVVYTPVMSFTVTAKLQAWLCINAVMLKLILRAKE